MGKQSCKYTGNSLLKKKNGIIFDKRQIDDLIKFNKIDVTMIVQFKISEYLRLEMCWNVFF